MMNPYEPPKTDSKTEYDRWLESVKKQDETDWGSFIFIIVWLFIFFFHQLLFNFFVEIFNNDQAIKELCIEYPSNSASTSPFFSCFLKNQ